MAWTVDLPTLLEFAIAFVALAAWAWQLFGREEDEESATAVTLAVISLVSSTLGLICLVELSALSAPKIRSTNWQAIQEGVLMHYVDLAIKVVLYALASIMILACAAGLMLRKRRRLPS